MKTTVSHEEAQINRFRKDPDRAVSYLNACLDVAFKENDPELVLSALSTVARAFGLSRLARDTELRRESLHRMLRKRGNPEWRSLFRVFRALHLRPKLERAAA
ncbi:MAG: putative addiction module antidote protein [Elusimicrobia bacterium RIFCSPLOWO2_01_FULL_59_12]|nr:MAG: putative addiction module antidote protein [Elusimicrobia bacterium RIFCSPLOWO2_01_FULL_59_12]